MLMVLCWKKSTYKWTSAVQSHVVQGLSCFSSKSELCATAPLFQEARPHFTQTQLPCEDLLFSSSWRW